jgi:hypothetical protein
VWLSHPREVLPQRGHGLRPPSRRASRGGVPAGGPRCASWSPVVAPTKRPVSRGKRLRVRDSRPLGSGMASSAFLASRARSTATTGAWPSATIRRRLYQESDNGDDRPFPAPRKGCCAGNVRGVRDPRPLGHGLVCLRALARACVTDRGCRDRRVKPKPWRRSPRARLLCDSHSRPCHRGGEERAAPRRG